MPLSSSAYETLSDLLQLRIDAFIVTNPKEALEFAALQHCRDELMTVQSEGKSTLSDNVYTAANPSKLRLPRRLQRDIATFNRETRAG